LEQLLRQRLATRSAALMAPQFPLVLSSEMADLIATLIPREVPKRVPPILASNEADGRWPKKESPQSGTCDVKATVFIEAYVISLCFNFWISWMLFSDMFCLILFTFYVILRVWYV
jgi:hypothetical protein